MANAEHTACGKLIPTQLWDFLIHLVFPLALFICAKQGFIGSHVYTFEQVLPDGQLPTQTVVSSGWVHYKPNQIFRNTQSWQSWHVCTTFNGNKLEVVNN